MHQANNTSEVDRMVGIMICPSNLQRALFDVIDFVDFPAADVLQPNQGLSFPDAFAALQIFCASPKFGGLIVQSLIQIMTKGMEP